MNKENSENNQKKETKTVESFLKNQWTLFKERVKSVSFWRTTIKLGLVAVPVASTLALAVKNQKLKAEIDTQQKFIETTGKKLNEALYQLGKAKQQLEIH